jgi:hypothetical protein
VHLAEQRADLAARGLAHRALCDLLGRALVLADPHEVGAQADLAQRVAERQHVGARAEQPDAARGIDQHRIRSGAGVVLRAAGVLEVTEHALAGPAQCGDHQPQLLRVRGPDSRASRAQQHAFDPLVQHRAIEREQRVDHRAGIARGELDIEHPSARAHAPPRLLIEAHEAIRAGRIAEAVTRRDTAPEREALEARRELHEHAERLFLVADPLQLAERADLTEARDVQAGSHSATGTALVIEHDVRVQDQRVVAERPHLPAEQDRGAEVESLRSEPIA